MPKVAIMEELAPNAFATGRDPNHAVVAVTTGIMRILDRRELAGVLAHELGHVKNRDILISSIAATIAGAITMLANMAQWAMIFGGFRGSDDDEGGGLGSLVGGLVMIIVGLGLGVTMIMLPVGVVVGLLGVLLVVGGLFARIDKS